MALPLLPSMVNQYLVRSVVYQHSNFTNEQKTRLMLFQFQMNDDIMRLTFLAQDC